jgi:hypothetical protein
MGCSHCNGGDIDNFHKARPMQPIVMSECCSCETQRGEDADQPHAPSVYFDNEQSQCLEGQTQVSDAVDFNVGTFIWSVVVDGTPAAGYKLLHLIEARQPCHFFVSAVRP